MYPPKPAPKRKSGMSTTQVVILVVLAAGNLLVFIVGGILVLKLSQPTTGSVAAITLPPSYTLPPTITPGPTATTTPVPTPTLWPTSVPILGWKEIVGQGVSLWLPEEYDGGNPAQELDALMERYITVGGDPKYTDSNKRLITKQKTLLFAFAPPSQEYGAFMIWVRVYHETISGPATADSFLDKNLASKFGPNYRVVGREEVMLDDLRTMRVLVETSDEFMGDYYLVKAYEEMVYYFIKTGNDLWILEYSCDRGYFDATLPLFEQSARSFRASTSPGLTVSTEGWEAFNHRGASLLLPPRFDEKAIIRNDDVDDLSEHLREAKITFDLSGLKEALPISKSVAFFHDNEGFTNYITWGSLIGREMPAGETLDSQVQAFLANHTGPATTMILQEEVTINTYPARHLIFEQQIEGEYGIRQRVVSYFILAENVLWEIHFECEVPVFDNLNPMFDLIAYSFNYSAAAADLPLPSPTPESLLSIENWVVFESSRVSIMLPPAFDGGDMTTDADAILSRAGESSADDDAEIFFFSRDSAPFYSSGYVTRETIPAQVTLDEVMDTILEGASSSMPVISQETVTLGSYTAKRLVVGYSRGRTFLQMVCYFIKDGTNLWSIYYFYDVSDSALLTPVIQLSINTFTIKK